MHLTSFTCKIIILILFITFERSIVTSRRPMKKIKHQAPFIALVKFGKGPVDFCTGLITSSRAVLTSKNCLNGNTSGAVYYGELDLSPNSPRKFDFDESKIENIEKTDIMRIKTETPIFIDKNTNLVPEFARDESEYSDKSCLLGVYIYGIKSGTEKGNNGALGEGEVEGSRLSEYWGAGVEEDDNGTIRWKDTEEEAPSSQDETSTKRMLGKMDEYVMKLDVKVIPGTECSCKDSIETETICTRDADDDSTSCVARGGAILVCENKVVGIGRKTCKSEENSGSPTGTEDSTTQTATEEARVLLRGCQTFSADLYTFLGPHVDSIQELDKRGMGMPLPALVDIKPPKKKASHASTSFKCLDIYTLITIFFFIST